MTQRALCLLRESAKAAGGFVGALASFLVARYALDLPGGWNTAIPALVTAAIVYLIPNRTCSEPTLENPLPES